MKHFRQKLAIILLDSELNKLKGCPMYHQPLNEETLANSDLEILDIHLTWSKTNVPPQSLSFPRTNVKYLPASATTSCRSMMLDVWSKYHVSIFNVRMYIIVLLTIQITGRYGSGAPHPIQ